MVYWGFTSAGVGILGVVFGFLSINWFGSYLNRPHSEPHRKNLPTAQCMLIMQILFFFGPVFFTPIIFLGLNGPYSGGQTGAYVVFSLLAIVLTGLFVGWGC